MDRRTFLGSSLAALGLSPAAATTDTTIPNTLPHSAPLSIDCVGLRAQDAEQLAHWYQHAIGLELIDADRNFIRLGSAGRVLLEIEQGDNLRRAMPTWAGLYHTAFLLPDRASLGRWALHSMDAGLALEGLSDHIVSESIYLRDPEGNGIEVYADRPQAGWRWQGGQIEMGTGRLDVGSLLDVEAPETDGRYFVPAGTQVGHVHLQVGDAARAAAWWQGTFGFDVVRERPDAVFLSTGGYHHHLAVNHWNSAGSGPMRQGFTGLAHVTLRANGQHPPGGTDLWGIEVRVTS